MTAEAEDIPQIRHKDSDRQPNSNSAFLGAKPSAERSRQALGLALPQESDRHSSIDTVSFYLQEIARYQLLTREQEIAYGKQVQQMMSLLESKESLAKKLRHEPTLSEWASHVQLSEVELNRTLQQGQRAKQKMVEANLRWVVAIAKRYQKRGLELLDLIQEGAIGLQRGVEKFDSSRGYKFSTYAYWWIRQGITRAIAQKGHMIRLPVHVTERLNKIKKAHHKIVQQTGRTAKISELAAELEIEQEQVRNCLEWTRQPVSLELPVGDNQDTNLGELLEDPNADPEKLSIQIDLVGKLDSLLAELKPRQREILSLRFGLKDEQALTLAKIGEPLNFSRGRVRQIETRALKRISQSKKVAVLRNYL